MICFNMYCSLYSGKSTVRYATLSLSAEEQEGGTDEVTKMEIVENQPPHCPQNSRQHKISIMSTDSEYANATDMTMQTTLPYQPKMHFEDDYDSDDEQKDPNMEPDRTQF